jgi:hypothetical protein
MAHDHHRRALVRGETTNDCRIIAEATVSMYLKKTGKESFDEVERIGSLSVSSKKNSIKSILIGLGAGMRL